LAKGQLPIVFSVVLSLLIITAALLTYRVAVLHRKIPGRRWMDMTLNIEHDFKNVLAASLANFTQEYMATGNLSMAKAAAERILNSWRLAITLGYGSLSAEVGLESHGALLIPSSLYTLIINGKPYGVNASEVVIEPGEYFNASWDSPYAFSAAYAVVSLNTVSEYLMGWNHSSEVMLVLNITGIVVDDIANTTTINFTAFNERSWDDGITLSAITIIFNSSEIPRSIMNLEYLGLGCYKLTIEEALDPFSIHVIVTDNRNITVRGSLASLKTKN